MVEIKVRYHGDVKPIEIIECGDWIDLRAAEHVEMKSGDYRLISLGVSMELPEGFEAHVLPRSSTFKKYGIIMANSMGVIDSSYCGDGDIWHFPALSMRDTVIEKDDRICQFRIMPTMSADYLATKVENNVSIVEVASLDNDNRGGFGSTGTK